MESGVQRQNLTLQPFRDCPNQTITELAFPARWGHSLRHDSRLVPISIGNLALINDVKGGKIRLCEFQFIGTGHARNHFDVNRCDNSVTRILGNELFGPGTHVFSRPLRRLGKRPPVTDQVGCVKYAFGHGLSQCATASTTASPLRKSVQRELISSRASAIRSASILRMAEQNN